MTVELTIAKARETLFQVVMEQGADYKYVRPAGSEGSCMNVHNGKGSCMIGRMFIKLGVPISWIETRHLEGAAAATLLAAAEGAGYVRSPGPVGVESYLGIVQNAQDRLPTPPHDGVTSLRTWGECLAAGDDFLRARNLLPV